MFDDIIAGLKEKRDVDHYGRIILDHIVWQDYENSKTSLLADVLYLIGFTFTEYPEYDRHTSRVTIEGTSPHFDCLDEYEDVPYYVLHVTEDKDANITLVTAVRCS